MQDTPLHRDRAIVSGTSGICRISLPWPQLLLEYFAKRIFESIIPFVIIEFHRFREVPLDEAGHSQKC